MTKDLPKEREITKPEALHGLSSQYALHKWVSDSEEEDDEAKGWLGWP
jgi:hypothetical protein